MNYEKIERRRKGSNIFCCDGYMYWKIMNTKIKLTCRVFFTKKTVPLQHILNSGSFFNIQKHNHPKSFAEIEKTKIEARLKKRV